MKRQHLRLAISIATLTFAISALAYAVVAQKQAADAGATARVARAAAETPRKPVTVRVDDTSWRAWEARIVRVERDAHEARACADWLLLVVRAVVTAWPQRPNLPRGPEWCVLGGVDGGVTIGIGKVGERREWKGKQVRP